MRIRAGDRRDLPTLLALFDEAVAWMVERGNTTQWGTEPWSAQPAMVERVGELVGSGELWLAELDGEPAGALITSDRPTSYVAPADEPELYVVLLLTSRRHAGKRIGSRLLDFAREQAQKRGVGMLRVDCYAGGTGELVNYYTRNGFVPTERLLVGESPVQVFEQRL
jgi:GNAT superfamily N-acetyltransferase